MHNVECGSDIELFRSRDCEAVVLAVMLIYASACLARGGQEPAGLLDGWLFPTFTHALVVF